MEIWLQQLQGKGPGVLVQLTSLKTRPHHCGHPQLLSMLCTSLTSLFPDICYHSFQEIWRSLIRVKDSSRGMKDATGIHTNSTTCLHQNFSAAGTFEGLISILLASLFVLFACLFSFYISLTEVSSMSMLLSIQNSWRMYEETEGIYILLLLLLTNPSGPEMSHSIIF